MHIYYFIPRQPLFTFFQPLEKGCWLSFGRSHNMPIHSALYLFLMTPSFEFFEISPRVLVYRIRFRTTCS